MRRRRILGCAILLVLLPLIALAAWPLLTPGPPLTWHVRMEGLWRIESDGQQVYALTQTRFEEPSELHAFDLDGRRLWQITIGEVTDSVDLLVPRDGGVIIDEHSLQQCYDQAGKLRWRFDEAAVEKLKELPYLSDTDAEWMRQSNGRVYGISADGELAWAHGYTHHYAYGSSWIYPIEGGIAHWWDPRYDAWNQVEHATLHVARADGELLWTAELQADSLEDIASFADGTVIALVDREIDDLSNFKSYFERYDLQGRHLGTVEVEADKLYGAGEFVYTLEHYGNKVLRIDSSGKVSPGPELPEANYGWSAYNRGGLICFKDYDWPGEGGEWTPPELFSQRWWREEVQGISQDDEPQRIVILDKASGEVSRYSLPIGLRTYTFDEKNMLILGGAEWGIGAYRLPD